MFSSGQAFVTAEEALFLLEFHGFKLFDATNSPESFIELNTINCILRLLIGNYRLTSFKVSIFYIFNYNRDILHF